MWALDHVSTGLPGLDHILDGLRWGDNVVWQVEDMQEYQDMVTPFVALALSGNYPVIYIRFGQHEPLLESHPQIKEYQLDASLGFEAFSSRVHAIATEEGEGACYIFDSLSDLLSAWTTDLMIVQPEAYIHLPVKEKYQAARLIGRLNRLFNEREKYSYMLVGPGRWGSSTPSLGLPVSFAEICHAAVLVEVAREEDGLMPELSFGTHFFLDLVETRIFYVALFPSAEKVVFDPAQLAEFKNEFADWLPEYEKWQEVIKVYDISATGQELWLDADIKSQQTHCFFPEL